MKGMRVEDRGCWREAYLLLSLNRFLQLEKVPVTYTLSSAPCGHWIKVGMVLVSATSTSSSSIVAVDAMLPLLGIPSVPTPPAAEGGRADPGGASSLPAVLPVAIVNGVPGVCLMGAIMGGFKDASSSSTGCLAVHPTFAPVPEMVSAMLSLRGCTAYLASELRTDKLSSFWGTTPDGREVGWCLAEAGGWRLFRRAPFERDASDALETARAGIFATGGDE